MPVYLLQISILIASVLMMVATTNALADWGYDSSPGEQSPSDNPPPVNNNVGQKAQVKSLFARPNTGKSNSVKKTADVSNATTFNKGVAVSDWLQLFDLVAASPLSDEQKSRFEQTINGALSKNPQPILSICGYWPLVTEAMAQNDEQKDNYRNLLRALLRQKQHLAATTKSSLFDSDTLGEILGPTRIAVAGDLPLTEDAINAYADMACFLYERKNPGKSLDATDNRAIFARVIADKFKDAPNYADKNAMAGFDLSWAKFKILWADAGEDERQDLISRLSSGTVGRVTSHDKALDALLKAWPLGGELPAKKPQS